MTDLLMLAIDNHYLPFYRHLTHYLSKPKIREEPVLRPSSEDPTAPDRQAAFFYGTVLQDEGKFRMWYYAKYEELPKPNETSLLCYAVSDDGIHWTKPVLGQKEVSGSRDNNAFDLPGPQTYGGCVIKDEDDPDPQRRYKMVWNPLQKSGPVADRFDQPVSTIGTATSPDGIRWTVGADWPVDVFVEQSSFYKHDGLYTVHGQAIFRGGGEGGSEHGRQGYVWVSPDFENWVQGWAEGFFLPEPQDLSKRGYEHQYDQVHLGVGAADFGNVQVGLYGLWHMAEGDPPLFNLWGTSCDLGLLVSNDGVSFREPVKGHVYISRFDSLAPQVPGKDYQTILCQYNGILNVGDETRIYHGRWRNAGASPDSYSEVALATLPRDRWGALGLFPNEADGWVWSAPVKVPENGWAVSLNADHPEQMSVEMLDERFSLLPEYSGTQSGVVAASDGLESEVRWTGANLSALAGKTVRLRVHLMRDGDTEPRIYAIYLREK